MSSSWVINYLGCFSCLLHTFLSTLEQRVLAPSGFLLQTLLRTWKQTFLAPMGFLLQTLWITSELLGFLLQTLRITSEQSVFARLFGRETFAGSSIAVDEDALECTQHQKSMIVQIKWLLLNIQLSIYKPIITNQDKLITCSCSSTTCIIVSLN
jgi:hypothetical protein